MIKIDFITKAYTVPFDPNEPIWKFTQRTMALIPSSRTQHADTCANSYLYRDQNGSRYVNTYAQRLMRIGDIVTDPTKGLMAFCWPLMGDDQLQFVGNTSPAGKGDRDVCAICLDELTHGKSFPTALRCGHIFHQTCIERQTDCPICRTPR